MLPTQDDHRIQGLKFKRLDDEAVGVPFLLIVYTCYF